MSGQASTASLRANSGHDVDVLPQRLSILGLNRWYVITFGPYLLVILMGVLSDVFSGSMGGPACTARDSFDATATGLPLLGMRPGLCAPSRTGS